MDNVGRREIRDYVTSSGTLNNCASGATPWGTWLTCGEDRTTHHGYVFEVNPRDPQNNLSRTPIRGMGIFSHEAVNIDPRSGIAYLTLLPYPSLSRTLRLASTAAASRAECTLSRRCS